MSLQPEVHGKWAELTGIGLNTDQQTRFNSFRFWRVVIMASVFYSFYYLGRLNWGIAMPWIIEDLGISKTTAGLGASLLLWSYAAGTFLSGRLGEIFGQRRLCLVGGIGTTIMNIIVALQTGITAIFIPWTVNGFIQGQTYAPINGMISNWYPKSGRGLATGIFATSMGLSTIVAWAITGWAVGAHGWRWAFIWPLVIFTLPMTIIFYFVSRNKPEEAGFPPYKVDAPVATESSGKVKAKGLGAYATLLTDWRFLSMSIASFSAYIARYGLLTWMPLYYAQTAGIAMKNVPLMTFGLPIGMAIGPVIGGWVSDHVFKGKRWQVVVTYALLAVVVLMIIGLVPVQTMGLTWGVVMQLISGLLVLGLVGSLFTAACDVGGRELAGTAVGTMNFFNYLGAGIQGVIIGAILDITGSWMAVWVMCAALMGLAALLTFVAKE
ncbi:MFS transporter [Phosphitispora fastidiosa]|uniref:MFS transporter n=1 Tax=Phosphitispora fastidiosa TaxID=2837202 RepID=UPI001E369C5F|nr:MFS transporter [Phosphitispora fastidiosa]MBU7008780.1 OPA family glycerol-3-phosphate transporter-like MFS transporter [Phosphitispora fastidiosa]